ncbi:AraC family transcriptional regulator [Luteibacter rhizovicinus]|uniref:AraC family transcriptional regulator n=1 Tax=Luteibacter rhizovicinus TaxID=242606 RepID=A0A4R3Z1K2_9GAMM|nr:AraC family transcriptional regulator [Luteibacter rhizovicinus]
MKISADELEPLFDALPDVVFFVKDVAARYTHANLTLVRRLGLKGRSEVIGKSVTELFPTTMGGSYAAQDKRVLSGEVIENQLEVHIFTNRTPGWCLTCKRPLRVRGEIRGVIGISRDLGQPDGRHPTYDRLRRVLSYMQQHYAEGVRVHTLAGLADLSVAQLERHFRRVFQLTPQQVLTKLRIEAGMRLLGGNDTVASIGLACGFVDQSAFARQFKATVGMTPRDYRAVAAQRVERGETGQGVSAVSSDDYIRR